MEGTTSLSLQLLIVDGQELRINPAASMETIQKFLGITPFLNYTRTLRWESMVQEEEVFVGKEGDCLEETSLPVGWER